jgi:hypothetical protein
MSAHAILSPSGAHRWLTCTPSARLEQQFPDSAGQAAAEGTLAHSLSELILRFRTKQIAPSLYDTKLKALQSDSLYESGMLDYCEDYAVFVLERFAEAQAHTSDAVLKLETKLNLTDYVPEGFGTGDAIIIADGTLDLIDLKYGKGVPVSAEQNKQMMLYALGALRDFDFVYDIQRVRMTIHQPRIENFSTYEVAVEDLKLWAEQELKPKAALAFAGEGEFAPGTHCRFCRAKAVCRALADYNLSIAKHEFKAPALLTDEELVSILARVEQFTTWVSAVEEHALNEAVNNGKKWPGYKLVEGRSNRKYADETAVACKLLKVGFPEDDIAPRKLLGITDMTKVLGKKDFAFYLDDLIVKPPGRPTLVPATDKRPEYNSTESAIADFQNV